MTAVISGQPLYCNICAFFGNYASSQYLRNQLLKLDDVPPCGDAEAFYAAQVCIKRDQLKHFT